MTKKPIRIMLVEDDPMFSKLVYFHLISFDEDFSSEYIQQVSSIQEFDQVSEFFYPEIVLLDLNLPDSNGLDTFLKVKTKCQDASIIILSGSDEEELSSKIANHGAQDYIIKTDVTRQYLKKAIHYCIERRRHQEIISKSEKRFRETFENSPVPMLTAMGNGLKIQMTNKAFNTLYEGKTEDFYGRNLLDFNSAEENRFLFDNDASTIDVSLHQLTMNKKDIRVELFGNKSSFTSDLFICLVIDKTEELKFQEEKIKLVRDAQESEKQKIAREIHDGLAQNLVVMNLLFDTFEFSEGQDIQREDFTKLIKSTLSEAKSISYALLPPQLENGFLSGLKNIVSSINSLKSKQVDYEIMDNVSEDDFDQIDKFNLFRITQEFFNNSIKYSLSELYTMKIVKTDEDEIMLQINDNGVGFNMHESTGSLGITNMLNRISTSNFNGSIKSEIGKGTCLEISFISPKTNY